MKLTSRIVIVPLLLLTSCQSSSPSPKPSGMQDKIRLITLDPGHFHAALVQKQMSEQVDPTVHIYAPEGEDLRQHIARIDAFNKRKDDPTAWQLKLHTGGDFLEQMVREKPGNVVVISGNNAKKAPYISASVGAGLNVLADKPMAINPGDLEQLKKSFKTAQSKGVLLYDIMTERYEITNALQRELSRIQPLFGTLQKGTPEQPAITKESVHHYFKYVSGVPLKRPAWFFDVRQQGEGIVDVTTHLVDLIQWECFPEQIIHTDKDVQMLAARHWATPISSEQFKKATGEGQFPEYLNKDVKEGALQVLGNGEFTYRIKGVHAKVSVKWNFEAPQGTGDTHYSMMRGTKCNLVIKQGAEQNYKPTLYVETSKGASAGEFEKNVRDAVATVAQTYPGIGAKKNSENEWELVIPDKYKVGHEAHFTQVAEKYFQFLAAGKIPEWEEPNMIAKYETIMQAYQMCAGR